MPFDESVCANGCERRHTAATENENETYGLAFFLLDCGRIATVGVAALITTITALTILIEGSRSGWVWKIHLLRLVTLVLSDNAKFSHRS